MTEEKIRGANLAQWEERITGMKTSWIPVDPLLEEILRDWKKSLNALRSFPEAHLLTALKEENDRLRNQVRCLQERLIPLEGERSCRE